jgi:hypothetical protein
MDKYAGIYFLVSFQQFIERKQVCGHILVAAILVLSTLNRIKEKKNLGSLQLACKKSASSEFDRCTLSSFLITHAQYKIRPPQIHSPA